MTDEKQEEKFDEKEMEKKEEKTPEEKSWDEKWRRDPLSAIVWALIFIWAGLVLMASNAGWLENIKTRAVSIEGVNIQGLEAWSVIFFGAGVIVLIEVIVRLLVPAYSRPVGGSLFLAAVFIGIGLGNVFGWSVIGPLVLIALGISVLLRGLGRKK